MLERLHSETELIRNPVDFVPGVNVILGSYASSKQESGVNGIGKSSLVRLIDYALLSDTAEKRFAQEKYDFLRDESHTITLQLRIDEKSHFIRRTFGKNRDAVFFGTNANRLDRYTASELKPVLLNLMFPVTSPDVTYEGQRFRTLIKFFIKDDIDHSHRSDPVAYFARAAKMGEIAATNFFLMNLPTINIYRFNSQVRQFSDLATKVKALVSTLEAETGRTIAEFQSERLESEHRIAILERGIREHRFLDHYRGLEEELTAVSVKISERLKAYHSTARRLRKLQTPSFSHTDLSLEDLRSTYSELSERFAGQIVKTLEQILEFRSALIANQTKYNVERAERARESLSEIEKELAVLESDRSKLMSSLDVQGPLGSVGDAYERLALEIANRDRSAGLLTQIDDTQEMLGQLDVELAGIRQALYQDVVSARETIDQLRHLFREIVQSAIFVSEPQVGSSYFDVTPRLGGKRDQLPFSLQIEIPKVEALGRSRLKVVAYDLMVFLNAVRTERKLPRFLVHDGVFHSIAKRSTIDTLNYVHRQSLQHPSFQYIVTFNDDELYVAAERLAVDGKLAFSLDDHTIARCTDDDSGMLFGRRF